MSVTLYRAGIQAQRGWGELPENPEHPEHPPPLCKSEINKQINKQKTRQKLKTLRKSKLAGANQPDRNTFQRKVVAA